MLARLRMRARERVVTPASASNSTLRFRTSGVRVVRCKTGGEGGEELYIELGNSDKTSSTSSSISSGALYSCELFQVCPKDDMNSRMR